MDSDSTTPLLPWSIRSVRGEGASGFALDLAADFYRRAGVLDSGMLEELALTKRLAARVWDLLHREGSEILTTLVARSRTGEVEGAISSVVAWESTYLVQHLAAVAAAGTGLGVAVMLAWFHDVMPWRQAAQLAFFVDARNRLMNAFHARLLRENGNDTVERTPLVVWSCPLVDVERSTLMTRHEALPLEPRDETFVGLAVLRAFGPAVASALSLLPGQFALPETTCRFARLGISRRRLPLVLADGNGVPRAAVFQERTSPGVNLTSFLDAAWLVPLRGRLSDDEASSLAVALSEGRTARQQLMVTSSYADAAALDRAGFKRARDVYFYTANRAGMHAYHAYIERRHRAVTELLRRNAEMKARCP